MYIQMAGIIGQAFAIHISYQKWVGTSVDSTDPLHFESQFWCPWIACFWSYSFPKV